MKKILIICLLALGCICCRKEYYVDGGHSGQPEWQTKQSAYEFMQGNGDKLFDSLVKIIDLTGMKAEVEKDGITLFAVTNAAVMRYQTYVRTGRISTSLSNPKPLEEISKDTLRWLVQRLIIPANKISLEQALKEGEKSYFSLGGDSVFLSAEKQAFEGVQGMGAPLLFYEHPKTVRDTVAYRIQMQTHNLVTRNAMIHVLHTSASFFNGIKK
ncbi:hypothetical protein [Chitinophaga defluvii]|uniref:Fasciclin domain-containing protein n=1 Tax=Chitinophaga defluvii TaxID=3163343 RepID=A0ABV2TB86_9BACT